MSRTSIKNKLNIQTVGTSLPSIQSDGEVSKHPQTGQLLVSNNNNWEPINADPSNDVSFGNYYIVTNLSSHTSPELYDLVYETSTHTLWRYHGLSSSAPVWQRIDWKSVVNIHSDFKQNRLRHINNYLEISPDGTNWNLVYPLVGARTIKIATSAVDNTSYSRLFWLPIGVTANISGANHLPIAFAKTVRPVFSVSSMSNTDYVGWVGLRPNNVSVSNGDGQYLYGNGTGVGATRISSLSIFPLCEQSGGSPAFGENRFFGCIYFAANNENRILGNTVGLGDSTFVIQIHTSSATVSSTTYWLGSWFRQDGIQFTPYLTTITRTY